MLIKCACFLKFTSTNVAIITIQLGELLTTCAIFSTQFHQFAPQAVGPQTVAIPATKCNHFGSCQRKWPRLGVRVALASARARFLQDATGSGNSRMQQDAKPSLMAPSTSLVNRHFSWAPIKPISMQVHLLCLQGACCVPLPTGDEDEPSRLYLPFNR